MRLDRDPGLMEAFKAAGGVGKLADLLGRAISTVSDWDRVPAEDVVEIERVTGVPRQKLRPDLYDGVA